MTERNYLITMGDLTMEEGRTDVAQTLEESETVNQLPPGFEYGPPNRKLIDGSEGRPTIVASNKA